MMTTIHRDSPSAAHPSSVVTRGHPNRPLLNSYQVVNPSKAIAWETPLTPGPKLTWYVADGAAVLPLNRVSTLASRRPALVLAAPQIRTCVLAGMVLVAVPGVGATVPMPRGLPR
jgi:hypothetical protein